MLNRSPFSAVQAQFQQIFIVGITHCTKGDVTSTNPEGFNPGVLVRIRSAWHIPYTMHISLPLSYKHFKRIYIYMHLHEILYVYIYVWNCGHICIHINISCRYPGKNDMFHKLGINILSKHSQLHNSKIDSVIPLSCFFHHFQVSMKSAECLLVNLGAPALDKPQGTNPWPFSAWWNWTNGSFCKHIFRVFWPNIEVFQDEFP